MIHEIAPHEYKNEYKPEPPEKDSFVLFYQDDEVLLRREDGEIYFPRFEDLEKRNPDLYEDYTYLFSIDGDRYYLIDDVILRKKTDLKMENIKIFRTAQPKHLAFAGITGHQFYKWYETHHFCGRCGRPMFPDEKERMLTCPHCNIMEYPKICPAVIVGIVNGNQILLSKYAGRDYKKYALLAGFAEVGESIEDTVRREVMEEVGLKVKNITYYKSQPWSFTDTLLLGFYAELDGDDEITLDGEELAVAGWFERDEIPTKEGDLSLTNEMITNFKKGVDIFNL